MKLKRFGSATPGLSRLRPAAAPLSPCAWATLYGGHAGSDLGGSRRVRGGLLPPLMGQELQRGALPGDPRTGYDHLQVPHTRLLVRTSLSPLHPGVPVHYTRLFLPDLHTRRLSYTGTLPTGRAGCVARTRRPSSTRKSTAPLPTARARTATWWRATSARGACLRPPIPTLGSLRRRRR